MRIALTPVLGLVALLASSPAPAGGIVVEPVVLEGDAVAGVGTVTRVDNLAINSDGTTLVEVDTDFADANLDGAMLRDGVLYLREGQALPAPGGALLDGFDSVNLNDAGQTGWNLFLDGTAGTNDDSGVYLDTTLVIQESDVSTSGSFSPGTRYIGFFDVKSNDLGQLLIVASVEDTAITSTVDRALVIAELDGNGALLSETVLAKEGDILPGQAVPVTDFGTDPHESSFNNAGSILYLADLDAPAAADVALYLDLSLIAQEGSPSPVPGRNYEQLSGRGNDLNNAGRFVFKANLDGDPADDDVIMLGDLPTAGGALVFRREGETIDAIAPFAFTNFGTASGPVQIDDQSKVVYFAQWNDPNPDVDSGLFLDEELIVQEGVTEVAGVILDTIASGSDAFNLSNDGSWLIFEGTLVGGIEGAFAIPLPAGPSHAPEVAGATRHWRASPNPLVDGVVLELGLEADSDVRVSIYDAGGRQVVELARGLMPAGSHRIDWNRVDAAGRRVAAGTYFARVVVGGSVSSRKLIAVD